jgi:hypothetical protein
MQRDISLAITCRDPVAGIIKCECGDGKLVLVDFG